jgi:hypothetical protein
MVRGVHSKRNPLASLTRRAAGFFTGLALVLTWAPPATADQAQGWFDPSRFTLRQSINTLTTTATNANGTSSAGHAYVSDAELGGAGSRNGALLRQTFLMPDAGARPVFVGLAVQFGYMAPGAAVPALASTNTRFAVGLTPILGFNYEAWQVILSPTVVTGIGANATTALAPAARLTRTISEGFDVGIEYAGALGQLGSVSQLSRQSHIVYGITDFQARQFWRQSRHRLRADHGLARDRAKTRRELRVLTLTLPTRGRGWQRACGRAYPLAAFLRQARCTAQVQPGGCDASSFDVVSLAGAGENGFDASTVSFVARA